MKSFYSKNTCTFSPSSFIFYGLLFLFAGMFMSLVLLAMVPPISRDALTHHLYIPRLYLQHGGIYEIHGLDFSYYPMNLDLLYMGALYFGSDILPKYIHMAFALATAWLLFRYLNKRLGKLYAWLGALFFLSTPIIIKLSITAYVDLGLVFFSTAALLLLFRWMETNYEAKYLALAGICCGLAIGCKYNGLLVFFLLTLFIPFLYYRTGDSSSKKTAPAIRACIFFIICTLIAISPWLMRNTIWTGNPIYPLYDGFFNPQTITSTTTTLEVNDIRGVFATRYALYGENIWQLLALPVRIFFEGTDDDPRYFDGRLNPFLFILPFWAFIRSQATIKQLRIEKTAILAFCLLYFLFAFNTGALRIRYLVPIVPFLVILTMYGLHTLEITTSRILPQKKWLICTLILPVGLMLAFNGHYLYQQFLYIDPLSYLSGRLSRDEYISKYRPEYPAIQLINKLPQPTKTLAIFLGNRGYYFDEPVQFDSQNGKSLFCDLLRQAKTEDEFFNALKEKGFTNLLLRYDLFEQQIQPKLKPEELKRLNLFFQNRTQRTYNANGHGVFQLL